MGGMGGMGGGGEHKVGLLALLEFELALLSGSSLAIMFICSFCLDCCLLIAKTFADSEIGC